GQARQASEGGRAQAGQIREEDGRQEEGRIVGTLAAPLTGRLRAVGLAAALLLLGGGCRNRLHFSPEAIAAHRMLDGVPATFLLGAATSAHQIEGGTHNDWTAWEKGRYPDGQPHVLDGASAAR